MSAERVPILRRRGAPREGAVIAGQPMLRDQRRGPFAQHVAVARRQVCTTPVQVAIAADQFGMRAGQPGHEPAAGRATQMQTENRHAGGPGGGDLAK